METIIDEAVRVAAEATEIAGDLIRARLVDDLRIFPKGARGDIVTDLDWQAESAIIGRIRRSFPQHRIVAEESGEHAGDPTWTWLVDPLDGTNNLALRIPLFGTCVTLCHAGQPVAAAVQAGHRGVTYTAARGRGARESSGRRVQRRGGLATTGKTTISWIQGYAADGVVAGPALAALGSRFHRVLQTWAPSVDWALLVEGRIAAVIAYENELEDLLGGALLAAEAGAVITDFKGAEVTDLSAAPRLIVAAPEMLGDIVDVLAEQPVSDASGP